MFSLLDRLVSLGMSPKHVASTHGGEFACACPGCGGRDRFRIWPEQPGGPACDQAGVVGTWFCRREDIGGDALDFLLRFEGRSWADACRELRLPALSRVGLRKPPRPQGPAPFEVATPSCPEDAWREHAAKLILEAHEHLLKTPDALAWLAARGLDAEAVRRYRLGYLEGENGRQGLFRDRATWGLAPKESKGKDGTVTRKRAFFIPRGILIPAFAASGAVMRIRIRRPNKDVAQWGEKYYVVPGSGMAPMVLGGERRAHIVVEAELDAMLVHHLAEEMVGAVAVLTNCGRPDAETHRVLGSSLRILVALDYDEAGAKGWPRWSATYPQARRWPVPQGKDPGDAYALGVNIRDWVHAGLPPVMTMGFLDRTAAQGEGGGKAVPPQLQHRRSEDRPRRPHPRQGLAPHALTQPRTPAEALRILTDACGLRVVATEDDFEIHGHERWPLSDTNTLFGWICSFGEQVRSALRGGGDDA